MLRTMPISAITTLLVLGGTGYLYGRGGVGSWLADEELASTWGSCPFYWCGALGPTCPGPGNCACITACTSQLITKGGTVMCQCLPTKICEPKGCEKTDPFMDCVWSGSIGDSCDDDASGTSPCGKRSYCECLTKNDNRCHWGKTCVGTNVTGQKVFGACYESDCM